MEMETHLIMQHHSLCQDVPGGGGLRCYKCSFGQSCSDLDSLVTCGEGERCSTTRALSDYKVHESIVAKGCLLAAKCNSQGKLAYYSNPFRATYSCCNSNYCNNGVSRAALVLHSHRFLLFMATFLAILSATIS
ncbi:hypothetical protein JRQ81_003480 [Phrynocephalus forsythii]|uniref:UPAR/Ly6 domain-containing protein n=1 Tax=Phrynocephalus forsythii TaxID=171643 RepID=A0A9Q0XM58_9SAUR|nr:hypothetical protein JRQ81_003480 [Phrynocephalus forsythii]